MSEKNNIKAGPHDAVQSKKTESIKLLFVDDEKGFVNVISKRLSKGI